MARPSRSVAFSLFAALMLAACVGSGVTVNSVGLFASFHADPPKKEPHES